MDWIKSISFDQLNQMLLVPFSSPDQAVQKIRDVSSILNHQREKIDEIYRDQTLVSAYTLSYMLSNATKMFYLGERVKSYRNELQGREVLDYGCGPGSLGLAFKEVFQPSKIRFFDISELKLRQAKQIYDHVFKDINIELTQKINSLDEQILLLGNIINELKSSEIKKLAKKIQSQFVFVVEPGHKLSFQNLIQFREELLLNGYKILYPCLGNNPCPLIQQDDWCHQYVPGQFHLSMEALYQKARLDRHKLPMSGFVFKKTTEAKLEQDFTARVVRKPLKQNKSYIIKICDQKQEISNLIVFKKDQHRYRLTDLKKLREGDLIIYEPIRVINHQTVVRILNISES